MIKLFLLLLASFVAAQTANVSCPISPNSYVAGTDLFPLKLRPQLSENFDISYNLSYKVLTNKVTNQTYILYMCNTPRPTVSGSAMFIEIPVDRVGINDRGLITYVERLNQRLSIKYINSLPQTASPCVQVMADQGMLGFGANFTTQLDLVFSAFGNETAGNGVISNLTVLTSIYSESNPLARMEWIYFVAAFYNSEALAAQTVQDVQKTYDCNQANMADIRPQARIAWIQRNADGTYSTVDPGWKAQLVRDAGAIPLGNGTFRSVYGTQQEVQNALLSADIVIEDTPGLHTFQQFLDAYGITNGGPTSPYTFVRGKTVFNTDRTVNEYGVEAWGEMVPAMPASALSDLIDITFDNYNPGLPTVYFRNIAKVDGYLFLNRSMCKNVSSEFVKPEPGLCPRNPFATGKPIPSWDTLGAPNTTTGTTSATGTQTATATQTATRTAAPTQTQAPPPPPAPQQSGGLSGGAIAGIVIGTLAAAGAVGATVYYSKRNRGYQPQDHPSDSPYSANQSANKGGSYVPMNDDGIFVPQGTRPLAGDDVELDNIDLESWRK